MSERLDLPPRPASRPAGEPPLDVYGECIIRTATTDGVVMLTFTPLEGMSEVVIGFLPTEMQPGAGFK